MKRINWTTEICNDIIDLSLTCVEIAKKHNVGYSTICKKRNSYLKTLKLHDFYIWTDEFIENVLENVNLSINDICFGYGYEIPSIEHIKLNPYLERKYIKNRYAEAIVSMRKHLGITRWKFGGC